MAPVIKPNLGLYLDRPPLDIPERGLTACHNVRITAGKLHNQAMGWDKFTQNQLNGPVTLIDNFIKRDGAQYLIFGTLTDLYIYGEINDSVVFITPRYETGTVSVNNGSTTVTGVGTSWDTELKEGDYIHFGAAGQNDPDAEWHRIKSVESATSLTLEEPYPGSNLSGVDYTARKCFTAANAQEYWRAETFPKAASVDDDLWFATNGVDPVVYWDGSADQVTFANFDFRCYELLRFKNMMVYANLTTAGGEARPYSIRVSDVGDPLNVSTGLAAEFIAVEGLTEIDGLYTLADSLIIYTQRSIVTAQFVGPPLIYIFRTTVEGLGPLSGRVVADFGDFHEFLGPDACYRFDGIGVVEVNYQVWREILRQQDPSRMRLAHSHFDEERGVVVWAIPRSVDPNPDQCEIGYLQHYVEDVGETTPSPFTLQDFPSTSTGFYDRRTTLTFSAMVTKWSDINFRWNDQFLQAAFPFNLFGDANGNIYTLGTSDSQDGKPIESWARFARRPAVDERHRGIIKRVYPFAERRPGDNVGLGVIVWTTDQSAGDLTQKGQYIFDLRHQSQRFVAVRQPGRFYEIEFCTPGQPTVFTLHGYDVDVVPTGER